MVKPIVIMPHSEITKSAIPDQKLFLQKTFCNSSVNYFGKRVQPWVGLIETGCIHGDWQKMISFYKNTKTKSLSCFISIGFITFADIIIFYDYS